jgi:hypothetical protein
MTQATVTGMFEVTRYAPIRIVLVGLGRMLMGAIPLSLGALIAVAVSRTPAAAPSAADLPPWTLGLLSGLFLFVGLAIFSGGVGRICSAFARNCYLGAGAPGIALRFPVQGWFGRFRVQDVRLRWDEIADFVHFTYRINGIPTSRELRIRRRKGRDIKVPRYMFSDSTAVIQDRLDQMWAQAIRPA